MWLNFYWFIIWFIHLLIHLIFTNNVHCARQCCFQSLLKSLFGFIVCFTLTFSTTSPKAKMMSQVKEWCASFLYCVWFPNYLWLFTIRQGLQGRLLVETFFFKAMAVNMESYRASNYFTNPMSKQNSIHQLCLVLFWAFSS